MRKGCPQSGNSAVSPMEVVPTVAEASALLFGNMDDPQRKMVEEKFTHPETSGICFGKVDCPAKIFALLDHFLNENFPKGQQMNQKRSDFFSRVRNKKKGCTRGNVTIRIKSVACAEQLFLSAGVKP